MLWGAGMREARKRRGEERPEETRRDEEKREKAKRNEERRRETRKGEERREDATSGNVFRFSLCPPRKPIRKSTFYTP